MRSLVLPLTVWLACVPSPRRTAPETTYAQPAVATQAHPYPQDQSRQHPPHASPQPVRRGAPPPAVTPSPQPAPATVASVSGCSPNGLEVIRLINAHRARHGLAAIPASPSLCTVAATHVSDLAQNQPSGGECNLHSWSNAGPWGACCYTSNHAQARCMWNKPRELTLYPGRGYENAHRGRGDSPRGGGHQLGAKPAPQRHDAQPRRLAPHALARHRGRITRRLRRGLVR